MAVWTGQQGNVSVGYADTATEFTDEACAINAGRTLAYITDTTKRAWDPNTAVTITYAGGEYTGTATVFRAGGYIRFSPALGAGITVSVSGAYIPIAEVCICKNFNFDVNWNAEDTTCFPCTDTADDTGWQKNKGVLRTMTGSMELLLDDTASHAWRDAIVGWPDESPATVGNEILFVELGITGSWAMYALVWPSVSITANASSLNGETVTFTLGDDPPCFI